MLEEFIQQLISDRWIECSELIDGGNQLIEWLGLIEALRSQKSDLLNDLGFQIIT